MFKNPGKPLIMGILNVTPDSFSDGGQYASIEAALLHAERMIDEGANIIDIGGESTRPGSEPVCAAEQINRVIPVIMALSRRYAGEVTLSIDTTSSTVADEALQAGAVIINDVSAGRDDPALLALAAQRQAPIILMHRQGVSKTMQDNPYYRDVVEEVLAFLQESVELALQAGIGEENIIIDPGIGFGKRKQDNIDLLANLERFVATGYPVLLGTSRKRFMGSICNESEPAELVTATAVTTALGVMSGVRIFRVHDIKENLQAVNVALAIKQAYH